MTGRRALPEFSTTCEINGRRVLNDEADPSAITGRESALARTEISGKLYGIDAHIGTAIPSNGHKLEFIVSYGSYSPAEFVLRF